MKRFHVHVSVTDLAASIRFYSALFAAEPTVAKPDYAKWMLDDPRINFAISTRGKEADAAGVDHLGFQVDSDDELQEMKARLAAADLPVETQVGTPCCYAKSDKYWSIDPQGVAWESYRTLEAIPVYGQTHREAAAAAGGACCVPAIGDRPRAQGACGAAAPTEAHP